MKKSKFKSERKTDSSYEALIKEQAERIAELKSINSDLTLALEEYRNKEKQIAEAVEFAQKKCAEMIAEGKVKYALEAERLKAYRKKWIVAAHSGALKGSYEQTERVLRECQKELEDALATDLCLDDYIAERERLNGEPELNYRAIADKERSKTSHGKIEELTDEELEELLTQL